MHIFVRKDYNCVVKQVSYSSKLVLKKVPQRRELRSSCYKMFNAFIYFSFALNPLYDYVWYNILFINILSHETFNMLKKTFLKIKAIQGAAHLI